MATKKILGLDLGVGSIGWALIEMEDDKASSILGMGSRIVPLTTDDSTQFSKGQAITKTLIVRHAVLLVKGMTDINCVVLHSRKCYASIICCLSAWMSM